MGLGDRGDDREPEARAAAVSCARRVGAVEALEDARRVLGLEARSVVLDDEQRLGALAAHGDANRRSRRRVDERVLQEVAGHLAKARLVAGHDRRTVTFEGDLAVGRGHLRVGGPGRGAPRRGGGGGAARRFPRTPPPRRAPGRVTGPSGR